VLAGLSLMVGLFPGMVSERLLAPAASAVIGRAVAVKLDLWHGINPAFALSVLTAIAGVGLYTGRASVRHTLSRLGWTWGPGEVYTRALARLNQLAAVQTHVLQSGYLRYYLLTVLLTATGLVGITFIAGDGLPGHVVHLLRGMGSLDVRFHELALAALILLAALAATVSRSSLSAVAALGASGYGVALIYLLFGAPDLAITQFLVESLTVILFVLAFYHLPDFLHLSSPRARARDVLAALLVGGLMSMLVLLAVDVQLYPSIAGYFGEHALARAHGRNIVNVILVDFRGLDTLGEITVLGIAAVGVYALLKLRKEKAE
jgi:multicomponent Na+:H+ antiporter subunit A